MGTVFRKAWTAPLPPGAEIIVQRGKRQARYQLRNGKVRTAEVFTAADGRVRIRGETKSYIAKFRDAEGFWVERPTGCSDETAARAVLAQLVRRAELRTPVVVFSYLNPILRYGVDRFVREADALGVAGVILTDLPAGGDPGVERTLQASPLDLIRLIAPTTRDDRLAEAVTDAQGFIYLVARLGVTGASRALADDLADSVARVRRATALPVAVGFGISSPAQAAVVARMADGVVVGSALVDALGRAGVAGARRFLESLRAGLDAPAGVA